ncbi:MAG TPA: CDP-alcohol phosphatidyltransferase family protein [Actinomycetota bacterium]
MAVPTPHQPPTPEARGSQRVPSDAILTAPNLITFLRLALIPVFVWLAIGPEQIGAAVAVGFVAGASDFVDGKVARRFNQVSKLGIALDPLSDRLLIAAAAAIIIVQDYAPLWVVIVVLARDALLLATVPLLSARGVPRPAVSWFGKAGTFGIMWGFGLFLCAHIAVPPARWVQILAWLSLVPGLIFAYVAAGGYARSTLPALRGISADGGPRVQ